MSKLREMLGIALDGALFLAVAAPIAVLLIGVAYGISVLVLKWVGR